MNKVIIFMAVFATILFAQSEHKSTIKAGVGAVLPTTEIFDVTADVTASLIGDMFGVETKTDGTSDYPVFFVDYDYALSKHFNVGAAFAYDRYESDISGKLVSEDKWEDYGTRSENYFTLAASGRVNYMNTQYVRLYGLIDLGYTLLIQKDVTDFSDTDGSGTAQKYNDTDYSSTGFFDFQLTPFGIEVGDKFGGFAELGFGYRGMFTAGAFARF